MNNKPLADNTPVLIGSGQVVERHASDTSPMSLAAQAAINAINDAIAIGANTKVEDIRSQIDTILTIRLFSDSSPFWHCKWGRSDNPPQSIAKAIGADPKHRIYSHMGGNEPQSRLIEMARDIARGEREMVLLTGAEAIKNQRHAERNQNELENELDWNEHFEQALEDHGVGESFTTDQEIKNGLNNVSHYYALIEQAQRHHSGLSVVEHQQTMAKLLASFSAVADNNPLSQFPGKQTAEGILTASPINHLYTKRMIAQDSVNQGAALLMCSLAKARELGIPESQYIYLHGMAEGTELPLSQRPDPALSPVANRVTDRALNMANLSINDIDLIDIYSCFPCAITAIASHLGLACDGSKNLTLTGGLPYFGGPGNNYSMHGLAEAVTQLRHQPESYAMVTCNGGVLSKHASGIYSRQPSRIDWATTETAVGTEDLTACSINEDPRIGTIVSYTLYPDRKGNLQAIILGQTTSNKRFVAITAKDDEVTGKAMMTQDPTGKTVILSQPEDLRLHFHLENPSQECTT